MSRRFSYVGGIRARGNGVRVDKIFYGSNSRSLICARPPRRLRIHFAGTIVCVECADKYLLQLRKRQKCERSDINRV